MMDFKQIAELGRSKKLLDIVQRGSHVVESRPGAKVHVFAQELACLFINGAQALEVESGKSHMARYEGITYICTERIPVDIQNYG